MTNSPTIRDTASATTRRTAPQTTGDSALRFLADGYRFGQRHFDRFDSDIFRARLAGRRMTFVRGAEGARFFSEGDRFTRDGAIPRSIQHLLQDEGSVQSLDDAAHSTRKALFLDILDDAGRASLRDAVGAEWRRSVRRWEQPDTVIRLYPEMNRILCIAVCRWAGVPLTAAEIPGHTQAFTGMIDRASALGPLNWMARVRRRGIERWAAARIRDARGQDPRPETPLGALASHRDADGSLMPEDVAAVELINLLRPTVALARFVVFGVLALEQHPEWRERVRTDPADAWRFAQEVRRATPFFPVVAGIARHRTEHRGVVVEAGERVALDLFATCRDPRLWEDPESFSPERFTPGEDPHRNALIPQGGGDLASDHRCPGEPVTIDIVAALLQEAAGLDYRMPPQNLAVDLRRIPALPRSGVILTAIREREEER